MYTERKMVIVTFVSWAKIFSDSIHMEVYPAYCIHFCFLHLGQGVEPVYQLGAFVDILQRCASISGWAL